MTFDVDICVLEVFRFRWSNYQEHTKLATHFVIWHPSRIDKTMAHAHGHGHGPGHGRNDLDVPRRGRTEEATAEELQRHRRGCRGDHRGCRHNSLVGFALPGVGEGAT